MYDFKNSFFPNFLLIHRAKYIFSRDMFCLYHFRAKIHGMYKTDQNKKLDLRVSTTSSIGGASIVFSPFPLETGAKKTRTGPKLAPF